MNLNKNLIAEEKCYQLCNREGNEIGLIFYAGRKFTMIFCNNLICKSCFEVVHNGAGIKLNPVPGTGL